MIATIQDLKMQIGQLANTMIQLQSTGSSNLPSQTIPNPRGNASAVMLRSGKELPQPTQHQMSKSAEDDSEAISHLKIAIPLSFPSRTISTRKPESDEEQLKMFRKVEINIPLLDAIKQIPKYAKFLKELCVHKRRKMKGSKEFRGVESALTRSEESTVRNSQVLPKKCRDPGIFSIPCSIGECTFADAMLDLGASINVLPALIYSYLMPVKTTKNEFISDLEPTWLTIQLSNRSIVQPLGVLEDVLVQVNELMFPADFYMLDMEDETSRKESTLILGRPFLMTPRTKIDVHAGTFSVEFGDTLVQFNIFEAMKHPTEDHSLFGIDMIEELVEEYFQPDNYSEDIKDSIGSIVSCLEADQDEVQESPNFEDNYNDVTDLAFDVELTELLDQVCYPKTSECINNVEVEVVETKKVLTIYELQQHALPVECDCHYPRPQNANWTVSKYCEPLQSAGSNNLSSQTIPNLRGNASLLRSVAADSEPNADSQPRPEKTLPVLFPTRTVSARKLESDEELLKVFQKVEINIPILDAIKQVPKYAKFLKELCVHKRKKMKGNKEIGGVVSTITRNEELTTRAPQALPKKCRDPRTFSVPCTIGECTFTDAMSDLGALINVMPASIYRALNFGDLEPIRMTIELANRSIVQPLGILEDVLVQVIELIFLADFYMLDMEGETSGKESTLIMGRPFLLTTRTKIDVHAGMLSMEFGDTLVQFNIFKAMKHPTEDHSLFGIDVIEELVEEYFQLNNYNKDIEDFFGSTDLISCIGPIAEEADYKEVQDPPNSEDNQNDIADLELEAEMTKILDQVCNTENPEFGQDPKSLTKNPSSPPPPMELKPLPNHLKYAYLVNEQQLPVIIANNLHQEQEDKLLEHKPLHLHAQNIDGGGNQAHKAIAKKTESDNRGCEVTKLLAARIIYPISDSQWVSLVQVVSKKSGMTIMKNQHDELLPTRIQNSWRVCIDYRILNQATRKDHFLLLFIDQVLEKLLRKSHYCFLDGFSKYMKIHIALEDQHKTTFTCLFGAFAYTRMSFGLCNAPSTFQRYMTSIFLDLL
ncbi:hypothetical protein CR513_01133, partial [Mucuna pruriens]